MLYIETNKKTWEFRSHRNLHIFSRASMSNDGENLAEGVRWKNEEGLMRCVYWLPKVTPQETSRDVCPLFNCEHELGVRRRWGLDASDVFVAIFVFFSPPGGRRKGGMIPLAQDCKLELSNYISILFTFYSFVNFLITYLLFISSPLEHFNKTARHDYDQVGKMWDREMRSTCFLPIRARPGRAPCEQLDSNEIPFTVG